MENGSIGGTYKGVQDNESGSHTQGCVLTQKRPVFRRGLYKVKEIDMAFCMNKCAVPS